MNRIPASSAAFSFDVPRTSGDEPDMDLIGFTETQRSPHERG